MKDIFLVDADDTLLDFRRAEAEQLSHALGEAGIAADERILRRFHAINDALWKRLERGETTRPRLVVERFEILLDEFALSGDPLALSAAYFARMKECAPLIDGATEFLAALKSRGRVFIVTNGSAQVQRSRLARSGIAAEADGVFISEEAGADKPSPLFARYVEARIPRYARERAVWVGDSLTSDMGCANAAGIDFVLFAPQGAPEGYAGRYARSYGELLRLLDGM